MDKTAFKKQIGDGKKFERKVQTLLETHSPGQVFRNVTMGRICEFDAIIMEYPLMTFIEIKRYRSDFNGQSVRRAVIKLRNDCTKAVYDADQRDHSWTPHGLPSCERKNRRKGMVTHFEVLCDKLNIQPIDGWRFRMVLIVPDAVHKKVLYFLEGSFRKAHTRYPHNLIDVDGIPLHVLRERAIPTVFG